MIWHIIVACQRTQISY